ncbi:hypothetical protein ACFRFQ_07615 [Rhodococcus sp. NPDC056743]|uniref:hypothetical protein n=1 Tax=Rhodococcus sp. NPDC056743 TaxID=3345934 RepID=UPI00366E9B46
MVTWTQVLQTITDGPDLPMRGTVVERAEGSSTGAESFAVVGADPMFVGAVDGSRIWRHGRKLRVENSSGVPVFISDGMVAWDFSGHQDPPRVGAANDVRYLGSAQFLLNRRGATEWIGDDFTRPTGSPEEVTYLGRDCWAIELAPPKRKPHPMQLVIDAETGMFLEQRVDAVGYSYSFAEVILGGELNDDLFLWTGPSVSDEELKRRRMAEHEKREREKRRWFEQEVTNQALGVRVPMDLTPERIYTIDEDSGAFEAGLKGGNLARRRRSDLDWIPGWVGVLHRWSTPEFDWAITMRDVELDDESLAGIRERLHPGAEVDRISSVVVAPDQRGSSVRGQGGGLQPR